MARLLHDPRLRRVAYVVLGVLALYGVLYGALSWEKELDLRHRPLGFDESFDFANGSFADYRAWSERRVRAARGDDVSAEQLEALLPFRLEPGEDCADYRTGDGYRAGVVLTHDVLDSAYTLRELGRALQSRCLVVYGLLLPGHGSRPGELLETRWQDWAAAQSFAVRALRAEAEYVYLAGHGAGGTLAILEAATNAEIDGLLLFAPQLNKPALAGSWIGSALGWMIPAARWADVLPAYSIYRYESRPWRLARELAALVDATQAALPTRPLEIPVFTAVVAEDATASTEATLAYMAERVHPLSATLIYTGQSLPEPRNGQRAVPASIRGRGLLSLSHTGLIVSMNDQEFGWNGVSRDCGHYFRRERADYARCMAGERTVMGELTPAYLAEGLLERTDFNPFFYDMLREADRIIAPVARVRRSNGRGR